LRLLQERGGNTLKGTGIDKDFLSRTEAAQQLIKNWQMGPREIRKLLHHKRNDL
jgi:hypothetical protein